MVGGLDFKSSGAQRPNGSIPSFRRFFFAFLPWRIGRHTVKAPQPRSEGRILNCFLHRPSISLKQDVPADGQHVVFAAHEPSLHSHMRCLPQCGVMTSCSTPFNQFPVCCQFHPSLQTRLPPQHVKKQRIFISPTQCAHLSYVCVSIPKLSVDCRLVARQSEGLCVPCVHLRYQHDGG